MTGMTWNKFPWLSIFDIGGPGPAGHTGPFREFLDPNGMFWIVRPPEARTPGRVYAIVAPEVPIVPPVEPLEMRIRHIISQRWNPPPMKIPPLPASSHKG